MKSRTFPWILAALPLALAACSDSPTSGGDGGRVSLRFGVARGASLSAAPGSPAAQVQAQGDQLVLSGDNGTLTIDDIRIVVAEFELKGDDDVNPCDRNGGGDDCEDFNAGPLFVDLPLSSDPISVSTGQVPPGTYREVEFEVEDLDDDEEDAAERQRIQQLFTQIRAQFNDWPRDASMLVTGTFTPRVNGQAGTPRPFRVFIEAEIEIELALVPPLVVTAGTPQDVTIELNVPALFRSGNNVLDLSQFNGRLLEFELEMRNGFRGRSGSNSGPG